MPSNIDPNTSDSTRQTKAEKLKARIKHRTRLIGKYTRENQPELVNRYRLERTLLAKKLADTYGEFMLINPQGKTEFLPHQEWATRMIQWMFQREQAARAMVLPPPTNRISFSELN